MIRPQLDLSSGWSHNPVEVHNTSRKPLYNVFLISGIFLKEVLLYFIRTNVDNGVDFTQKKKKKGKKEEKREEINCLERR